MSARRWPVVTLGLIAVNVIVFLLTHSTLEDQQQQSREVKLHLIILAAMHPELTVRPEAQKMLAAIHAANPKLWEYVKSDKRQIEDAWDARMRLLDDPEKLQEEMDSLGAKFGELEATSLTEQYAFIPAAQKPITYLTANFLHGGWLHLIGNMWFLWLAGFVLEDTWGRPLYTIFYFVAGAAAMQFHAWTNAGSLTPALGASGAVAGLMGAFLLRFPKMRIQMRWILGIRSLLRGGYQFSAPAYALLPLWLLTEVLYGTIFGQTTGVAHWAHVGGFAFGALMAPLVRYSHLEHLANKAIEEKVGWTSDPEIAQATELMEKGQNDEAINLLERLIAAKPESVDACNLLQQTYWRKGDIPRYQEVTAKLCALHLKARENDLAWHNFEEFINTGGKMPVATWFELCRVAEGQQAFDRALSEYQKLIAAYPTEKRALQAQIAAGRICLKQLNRPQEALAFYETAAASPIPHLDWEQTLAASIREARKALEPATTGVGG